MLGPATNSDPQDSIHRTQILRCNLSHHRLFPKRHGFSYSYLMVGIPIRSTNSNWLVSVDTKKWWRRGMLFVTAKDHLNRGREGGSLSEKLDFYLRRQGLEPSAYPHVYLITSPRFLNYNFSPASFWYLYSADLKLDFVIAEVNNTFGERRMYLFPSSESTTSKALGTGAFSQSCFKDFHVSPFSSRKGSYSISSANPADAADVGIVVTLHSSKGHPKLIVRLWSNATPINPTTYPIVHSIWFLICWGWTILVTFPRIIFHAIFLAQYHKLSVYYRPEPVESTVARTATSSEAFLASVLLEYLRHLLHSGPQDLDLLFHCGMNQHQLTSSSQRIIGLHSSHSLRSPAIELRVQTPQFYRQMITYKRFTKFLTYTLLDPYKENRTAWSSDAENLIAILGKSQSADQKLPWCKRSQAIFPRIMWYLYDRLRSTEQLNGVYPNPGLPQTRVDGGRRSPMGSLTNDEGFFMDTYVRNNCALILQVRYIMAVLSLQFRTKVMNVIGGE